MTTYAQRIQMGVIMDLLVHDQPEVHYAEVRPMRTRGIRNLDNLESALAVAGGITMDCSESVTLICRVAGLLDPNGFSYDGEGNTATLLKHLPHYTDPRAAHTGALVVFGPGGGEHVAMVRRPGTNPTLFSHGFEGGPIYISLSQEAKAHDAPVTFLSIARL